MKRILGLLLLFIAAFQTAPVQAGCFDNGCCNSSCFDCCNMQCGPVSIEGRFAAFFPLDSKVCKIYNDALPSVEVEASMGIWNCLQGFFNASYVWNEGRSIGLNDKTNLELIPLAFGLKWVQPIMCDIDAYLGAGATYSFLRIKDHSPFVHEHVRKEEWGGTVKAGFIWHYTSCIFLEGFVDYYYTKFKFHTTNSEPFVYRHDADLSAVKLGFGLGYSF